MVLEWGRGWRGCSQAGGMPLVGVWVAGVASAGDAHVWAACLRFLLSSPPPDRVVLPDGSFLVLIYSAGEQTFLNGFQSVLPV